MNTYSSTLVQDSYRPLNKNERRKILVLAVIAAVGIILVVNTGLWLQHRAYYTLEMENALHQAQAKLWVILDERITALEKKHQCECSPTIH